MGCLKNEKVLVTGAAGFIGSHLLTRLIVEEADVAIIIRKSTDLWKIKDLLNNLKVYYCDINDKEQIEKIELNCKPDYLFHLAAYGVDSKDKDYYKAININFLGGVNVINPLTKIGCKKIINIGSSSEYGKSKFEENGCLEPLNIYGSTKAASTIVMHQIARENNLDIITLRPFGLFGEREEKHKIFSYIITEALKNKDVMLTSCEQLREYLYVENLIDAIILATKSDLRNEIFNIGTGNARKLKYYVEKIFEKINTKASPRYNYYSQRTGDMWGPCANVEKIKDYLHWKERINFEDGLEKTIKWFESNLKYYP
ncbi:NAD-dependent epimerase/dehydratase family protein [Clostridium grantii]|uniref:Nucleoside-diphosphate-sugar epimerase n=1 Tax=Clostridium grantii DSM 8605 TaxID=1121316 RepID=A0A1M5RT86_9CLOT|nr:SDR family NAD(P)-dependent oxidoreductase [Clostridium grantii]SHH29371.1 Nucleoside-diphosphate-sugar epimerase [Clostridium grantii DSM 8605]